MTNPKYLVILCKIIRCNEEKYKYNIEKEEDRLIKKTIKRFFKKKYRLGDILVGELTRITVNLAFTEGIKHYQTLEKIDFFVPLFRDSSEIKELFLNKKINNFIFALTGDLAYRELVPFVTKFSKEMFQVGLTPNTKLTVEELWQLKTKMLEKIDSHTKSF